MNTTSKLLSPEELSEFLGISVGTLAVWRTNKTYPLPYIKVGSRIRYDREKVLVWLDSRKQNSPKNEV